MNCWNLIVNGIRFVIIIITRNCNMRSNISGAYFYIKEAKYEIKMRIAQHINCTILIMLFNIR